MSGTSVREIAEAAKTASRSLASLDHVRRKKALQAIAPVLGSLDAAGTSDDGRFTFATDHGAFLIHGVPSFVLWTGSEKYRELHHKPSDTFDKVDQRDLNLGAAVVGITAFAFADASTVLPHLSAADVDEQLKKMKAYDEFNASYMKL